MARALQYGPRMRTKLNVILPLLAFGAAVATAATALAKPAKPATPKEVRIAVTSDGFDPAEIRAKAGVPLRLVVTRTTDRTCVKSLVIKDLGIDRPLPLNQPVTVDLTPKKDGQLRYACSMDMVAGTIVVD